LGTTTWLAFLSGIAICVVMPTMLAQTSHTPPSVAPGQGRGESPAREGTGVVRGLVTSAQSGAPLRRARVWVRSSALPSPRSASTDESGRYEIAGLQPGSYFVRTSPSPADASFNLASSYYPGTQDAGSAEPVAVGLGAEIAGVDFQIQPGGLAVVRGVVVDDRGQPAGSAQIALVGLSSGSGSSAAVRQSGSFVFQNVAPGDYQLAAMRINPASGERDVVQRAVTVAAVDSDGLSLVLGRGGSVSGAVVADEGSLPEPVPGSLRVRAVPLGGALPVRLASAGSGALGGLTRGTSPSRAPASSGVSSSRTCRPASTSSPPSTGSRRTPKRTPRCSNRSACPRHGSCWAKASSAPSRCG
jgi:hypothetical protein